MRRSVDEVIWLSGVFAHFRARNCWVVQNSVIFIITWTRCVPIYRGNEFLTHTVFNICFWLLWFVEARTWLCSAFEWVNVRFAARCVFRACISINSVHIFTRTRMLDFFSSETFVFGNRPIGCLFFICSRCFMGTWARHMAQSLVIDKLGN